MKNFVYTVLFSLVLSAVTSCSFKTLTVDNAKPRRDIEGKIVDAHDGRVIQFGDTFYWYGTRYGSTNGYTEANEYVCYSSLDLKTWKYEGALLPQKPTGVYYRPHVVYNATTRKYVLWYNWYPKLWNGQFGVATSDNPTGPFTIVNDDVKVRHSGLGVGDLGVFVDDDGSAYLSYNTINGHKVSVEKLNEDYTRSTLQGSEFIAQYSEAGAMFKRAGTYYLMTDYTCCFCTQGSGARVFTASNPLGPYTYRQNINRYPGEAAPLLTDGNSKDNLYEAFTQKGFRGVQLQTEGLQNFSSLLVHQFTGNRKGQCGEVANPRTHDTIPRVSFIMEYWNGNEWKALPITNVQVNESVLSKSYLLSFSGTQTDALRIYPQFADTLQTIHLSEIFAFNKAWRMKAFKLSGSEGKPIIPAQQAFVMPLQTQKGTEYIWMGDLWGSASDNVKGHDYQFWSAPLKFYESGLIQPLQWSDGWTIKIK